MQIQITIDGPAGTGKSTVAAKIAKLIDFQYISSGLIYRLVAYYLIQNKVNIYELTESMFMIEMDGFLDRIKIDDELIYLDGTEISSQLYTEKNGLETSKLSQNEFVRDYVNEILVDLSRVHNIVIDGRDMGSVVFKDALIKFYLDASIETRTKRRYLQLQKQEPNIKIEDIREEIIQRDNQDKNRHISPLVIPKNAFVINTDDLTINEVINKMLDVIKEKLKFLKI